MLQLKKISDSNYDQHMSNINFNKVLVLDLGFSVKSSTEIERVPLRGSRPPPPWKRPIRLVSWPMGLLALFRLKIMIQMDNKETKKKKGL